MSSDDSCPSCDAAADMCPCYGCVREGTPLATWHFFECLGCRESVVVDLRTNAEVAPKQVVCPICQRDMMNCGNVPADEDGYKDREINLIRLLEKNFKHLSYPARERVLAWATSWSESHKND